MPEAPRLAPTCCNLRLSESSKPWNAGLVVLVIVVPLKLMSCDRPDSDVLPSTFQSIGVGVRVVPSPRTICAPFVMGVPSQCLVAGVVPMNASRKLERGAYHRGR